MKAPPLLCINIFGKDRWRGKITHQHSVIFQFQDLEIHVPKLHGVFLLSV